MKKYKFIILNLRQYAVTSPFFVINIISFQKHPGRDPQLQRIYSCVFKNRQSTEKFVILYDMR